MDPILVTLSSDFETYEHLIPSPRRGIAELIVQGSYSTIDLSRLGYERVEANAPYAEIGIL